MLELGIILLVLGVCIVLIPALAPIQPVGWILVLLGIVLVVLAVVDVHDARAGASLWTHAGFG